MENNQFTYRYSAVRAKEVENIRKKYIGEEERGIDALRKLDRRVRSAGMLSSLVLGIIGCLTFGIGMCFGLDVFAGEDILTLIFCVAGALIMLPAYPLYKYVANETRAKLSPEILRLADEILRNEKINKT